MPHSPPAGRHMDPKGGAAALGAASISPTGNRKRGREGRKRKGQGKGRERPCTERRTDRIADPRGRSQQTSSPQRKTSRDAVHMEGQTIEGGATKR